jgi:MinD superfamily P-loop ATPase
MEKSKFKIAVLSGKGGVGKSMLASSLAILFERQGLASEKLEVVAVDADADAPNLDIWLGGVDGWDEIIPIVTSEKPVIDYDKCDGCGLCAQHCKFSAMKMVNGRPVVNPFLCEGCGVCESVCPRHAIQMKPVQNGEVRIKNKTQHNFPLFSGQLFPGEAGSGKVTDAILQRAKKADYRLMIIDTAPGSSCSVKAVLRETDFVVAISEPTISGFSDLKRVLEVVDFFHIPYCLVINKSGINSEKEKQMSTWAGEKLLGKISYDAKIFQSVSNFIPIVDSNLKAKEEISKIYKKLSSLIALQKVNL